MQDADPDAGRGVSAVLFEVELSFEGVVDRLDHLPQRLEQVGSRARRLAGAGRPQQRDAVAVEREVLLDILATEPELLRTRPDQTLLADKNYYGREFETTLAQVGLDLLRPARKGESPRPGTEFFKPLRQVIESVNDTFKGQLDLEHHGGHTPTGVWVRVLQRILALTAVIWHNDHVGAPTPRSLIAYDH